MNTTAISKQTQKEGNKMWELIATRNIDVHGRFLVPTRGMAEGQFPAGTIFLWDGVPGEKYITVQEKYTKKMYLHSVFCESLQELDD